MATKKAKRNYGCHHVFLLNGSLSLNMTNFHYWTDFSDARSLPLFVLRYRLHKGDHELEEESTKIE